MADPFSPNLDDLASSAQSAREVAARRLAGNVKARPREVPYPWASMGDWLTEALRPERIEDLFMGLGTDAPSGIRAFHGSPHSFERFDASKIGSGEGAQAYGHGLYFAEQENVARDYQRRLAPATPDRVRPDEKAIADYKPQWDAIVAKRREAAGPDFRGDTSEYDKQLDALTDQMTKDTIARNPKALEGHMYQVAINAEPEHFLDWDKPLSEQHPKVQQALKEINAMPGPGVAAPELTGNQILTNLSVRRKMTHEQAAQALRDAGIPGIRYLDQGSRFTEKASIERDIRTYQSWLARNDLTSAQRAEQTRLLTEAQQKLKNLPPQTSNYVVFNDQLIDILKKYGIAGLIAAGAYHQQEQQ